MFIKLLNGFVTSLDSRLARTAIYSRLLLTTAQSRLSISTAQSHFSVTTDLLISFSVSFCPYSIFPLRARSLGVRDHTGHVRFLPSIWRKNRRDIDGSLGLSAITLRRGLPYVSSVSRKHSVNGGILCTDEIIGKFFAVGCCYNFVFFFFFSCSYSLMIVSDRNPEF